MKGLKKIIFLGNGSDYSIKAQNLIDKLSVKVVAVHNNPNRFNNYNYDYDVGISFLYPYLVPKKELTSVNSFISTSGQLSHDTGQVS